MKHSYQNPIVAVEIFSEQEILTGIVSSSTGALDEGVIYSWKDIFQDDAILTGNR